MGKRNRVVANLSFTFVSRITETVAGMAVIGMLSRYLGLEEFGRYSVFMAIGWIALPVLNMGFPKILARETAQQQENAAQHVMIGWTWNLAATATLLISLLLFCFSYRNLQDLPVLIVLGLTTGITAMTHTATSLSVAFQRMQYETVSTLATLLLLTGLVAGGIYYHFSLTSLFISHTLASLAGLLLTVKLTHGLAPYLEKLKQPIPNFLKTHRKILSEAVQIGLFQLLVQVYLYAGVFVLKLTAGDVDVALFQAPFRIFIRVQIIPMTVLPVLLPIFSRLFFTNQQDELQKVTQNVFKSMLVISLLCTVSAYLLADDLIPLILGADFKASSYVFKTLSLSICFLFLNMLFNPLFIASKKAAPLVYIQGAGILACVLLNLFLIPYAGAVGSSWAIVISSGLMVTAKYFFFKKLLQGILIKTMLSAITAGAIGYLLTVQPWANGTFSSLLLGVVCCLSCSFLFRLVSVEDIVRTTHFLKQRKKNSPYKTTAKTT